MAHRCGFLLSLMAGALIVGGGSGCGSSNPLGRKAISGEITLDGKALEQGNIRFEPLERTKGAVASGAVISSGAFSMAEKNGLPPGKYRVRVFSSTAAAPQANPPAEGELPMPGAELPGRELVPTRYNTKSEIVHEVSESGDNRFVLDMTTP